MFNGILKGGTRHLGQTPRFRKETRGIATTAMGSVCFVAICVSMIRDGTPYLWKVCSLPVASLTRPVNMLGHSPTQNHWTDLSKFQSPCHHLEAVSILSTIVVGTLLLRRFCTCCLVWSKRKGWGDFWWYPKEFVKGPSIFLLVVFLHMFCCKLKGQSSGDVYCSS